MHQGGGRTFSASTKNTHESKHSLFRVVHTLFFFYNLYRIFFINTGVICAIRFCMIAKNRMEGAT